jgi:hypothetical protein
MAESLSLLDICAALIHVEVGGGDIRNAESDDHIGEFFKFCVWHSIDGPFLRTMVNKGIHKLNSGNIQNKIRETL